MTSSKRRLILYLALYSLIVIIALFSLVMNIRTVPIIEKRQQVVLQTQRIKEENRELRLQIETLTSLENIEKNALQILNMKRPQEVHYIR